MYFFALIFAIVALVRPVGSHPHAFPAHRKFVIKKMQNAYYPGPNYGGGDYKQLAASPMKFPSIVPLNLPGIAPFDLPGIAPGSQPVDTPVEQPAAVPAPVPVTKPAKTPVHAPASPPGDVGGDSWQQTVVAQHNVYRSKYGAKPLAWSDQLYPDVATWANQCDFQHSQGRGVYGENLAAGSGSSYGFPEGLTEWMNEVAHYDYSNPTFASDTGHFTAVIWKSTSEVACAISDCPAGTIFGQSSKFIVCRYSPPGNVLGQFVENVGRLLDGLGGALHI